MKILLKHVVAVAALSVLVSACGESRRAATDESPAPGAALPGTEQVVNVYNWSDYIDPEVIQGFEQATGIKVRYDVFDSNEVLETKLLTGNSGYDIVVPSAYFLQRQVQAGVFAPLDKAKLPGLVNSDP
jgi:putrescine transport system substrate-binding protein